MSGRITTGRAALAAWLEGSVRCLANHSDRLNAINIFPVADGDTGNNLYLTARTAHDAVSVLDTADLGEFLGVAGRAAIQAAHGNSGTLLAVFLAGFAEPLAGHERLTAPLLAAALDRGSVRAWSALSEPVPGTMLSVMQAAAAAAGETAGATPHDPSSRAALAETLEAVRGESLGAVVATEGQLGPLAEAHIVDAGAVGTLLVLDQLRAAVLGADGDEARYAPLHGYGIQDPHLHADRPPEDGVEVMCTIALGALEAATLRARLDAVGTSVAMSPVDVAESTPRWRVHVHVPDADDALRVLADIGDPVNVSVTALHGHGA